ncbi:MAG: hypothetical protein WCL38_08550 [Actinomycetota bacterium]
MDTTTIITNLTIDWLNTEKSHAGQLLLHTLEPIAPGIREVGLTSALSANGPLLASERFTLLSTLLELSAEEPIAGRALVQALLPGLLGVGRSLGWGKGLGWETRGDFLVDAISSAFEVCQTWAGQHRKYAGPDVLSAVRLRLRRQGLSHRGKRTTDLSTLRDLEDLSGQLTVEDILATRLSMFTHTTATVLVGRLVSDLTWGELRRRLGLPEREIHRLAEEGARQLLASFDLTSDEREPSQTRVER